MIKSSRRSFYLFAETYTEAVWIHYEPALLESSPISGMPTIEPKISVFGVFTLRSSIQQLARMKGKAKKARTISYDPGWINKFRRRPTLPPRRRGSTIGAGELNFRVRDGNGCFLSAITAGN